MTQEEHGAGKDAQEPAVQAGQRRVPEIAAVLAWLVPGLGHFYLGQRPKAIILLCAIMTAFVVGVALADFQAISIEHHKYAFFAQIGAGGPTLSVLAATAGGLAPPGGREVDPLHSVGLLYTMVAGLLNFVVACDAYERVAKGRLNAR
jgi:hypothetical protein